MNASQDGYAADEKKTNTHHSGFYITDYVGPCLATNWYLLDVVRSLQTINIMLLIHVY